jgi:hypothetical protein
MKLKPLVPPQATAGVPRRSSLDSSSSVQSPSKSSSSFRSAGDFKKFLGLRAEAQGQEEAKAKQANTVSTPSAPAASSIVAVAAVESAMTEDLEAEIGTASAETQPTVEFKKLASRVTIPKPAASELRAAPAAPAPVSASAPSSQAKTSYSAPQVFGGYATILSGPITSVTGVSRHKFDVDGGVMQFVARFDGVELSIDDLAVVAEDVPFIQDKAYLWVFHKEGGHAAKAEVTKPQMQRRQQGHRSV